MRPHLLVAIASATLAAVPTQAQESAHAVAQGRDFVAERLLSPGLTDTWDLEADRDEMLLCSVASRTFDPVLQFVDAEGHVLGEHDGEGTESQLWIRVPADGAYTFRVKPYRGSGGGTYTYRLHRFRTAPLEPDTTVEHTFGAERWWHYRLPLRKGDVVAAHVEGAGRVTALLSATDRTPLPANVLGAFAIPTDGDWFLRIEGPEDESCRTRVSLARQRDGAIDTAAEERLPPHGLDVWRFPVRAGEVYLLEFAMADAMLRSEIVDPVPIRGEPCFVMPTSFNKGGRARRFFFARRDGQIELRLGSPSDQAARYTLALDRLATELPDAGVIEATLPLGTGEVHRFTATSGQLLQVTLDSDAFDPSFEIWGPDGSVIVRGDDRGLLDRGAQERLLIDRPGTYRVLVQSAGGVGSGPYRLSVAPQPVARLEVGGTLDVDVAADRPTPVHVDLEAGQTVWLAVESAAIDASLRIVTPDGEMAKDARSGGIGYDVLTAFRPERSGRHTLWIGSERGAGRAHVRAVRP